MIKIIIDFNGNEADFTLINSVVDGTTNLWSNDYLDEKIEILEKEGDLIEDSLVVSAGISTLKTIIFERISYSISQYKEQILAGFEPADETITLDTPEPYNPDDIKVRRESFSVFETNRMMMISNDIDLNPDFQRNLVWDNTRKSALIESILLGIPIPMFYFAESKSGQYNVVDGLQRLSTIKQYLNNEFYLKKLEHLGADCNGKFYMEVEGEPKTKRKFLERKHSRRLENAQLIVNVIEYASPQKVKYDIFKRLNTGGRPLNKQEVRNCIATNEVRKFLKKLATSEEFLTATDHGVNDNRMDAQELVLRFVGFRLEKDGKLSYGGNMNSFLDETIDLINELDKKELLEIMPEFLNSMKVCYYLFGEYSFRKCLPEHLVPGARRQFINKAMFVSWCMITYKLDLAKIQVRMGAGNFSSILAEELYKKGKYYTILTTGTSDKQNLIDSINFGRTLLQKENLI